MGGGLSANQYRIEKYVSNTAHNIIYLVPTREHNICINIIYIILYGNVFFFLLEISFSSVFDNRFLSHARTCVSVRITQYTNNLQNCQNEWALNRQYEKGQKCVARSSFVKLILYNIFYKRFSSFV